MRLPSGMLGIWTEQVVCHVVAHVSWATKGAIGNGDAASGPGRADCAVLRWSRRLEIGGCLRRADPSRTRRSGIYRPGFAADIRVGFFAPARTPPALVAP